MTHPAPRSSNRHHRIAQLHNGSQENRNSYKIQGHVFRALAACRLKHSLSCSIRQKSQVVCGNHCQVTGSEEDRGSGQQEGFPQLARTVVLSGAVNKDAGSKCSHSQWNRRRACAQQGNAGLWQAFSSWQSFILPALRVTGGCFRQMTMLRAQE